MAFLEMVGHRRGLDFGHGSERIGHRIPVRCATRLGTAQHGVERAWVASAYTHRSRQSSGGTPSSKSNVARRRAGLRVPGLRLATKTYDTRRMLFDALLRIW